MKKLYLMTGFCLLLCSLTTAQVINRKNSIRVGADIMSMNGSDDLRGLVRYARHLSNDRIVLEGSVGYNRDQNWLSAAPYGHDFYYGARPRGRFMFDATASLDLIRNPHHALRVGGGPSVWFQKNEIATGVAPIYNYDQLIGWRLVTRRTKEFSFGYNLAAEYEYLIGSRLSLSFRASLASINKVGTNSAAGVNIGYHF
jgi:hypothetical protein